MIAETSVVRLLISDVDGTLVTTEKVLTPGAIAAVGRLRDAGVRFAIVSSRPPRGMAMMAGPLHLDTPIGAFNGGVIVGVDGSLIESRFVPQEAIEVSLAAFVRAGVDAWVFADNQWIITNPNAAYVPRERMTVQFEPTIVTDFSPYLGRVGKLVGTSSDFEALKRLEVELHDELGGRALAHRSQNYYLDVTHPDANKGTAAHAIAEHLGISLAETACIGDMGNDVPMLRVAGLAIAMGNAPDAVKAEAHVVTDSNEAEGFAAAVDRFVLPRAPRPA